MMSNVRFAENEIGYLLNKFFPVIKKRKFYSITLYLLFITYFSLPSFEIPLLEYSHIRITSLMEQRAIENGLFFYPKQSWVSIDKVNPNLLKSIICMEDDAFFQHKGIDWTQLDDALKLNKRKKRIVRGGSTLTMQLAKNLYLNTGRNFFRKAKEMLITFRMEKEVSKRTILQDYINVIEWGGGVFGIKEAAKKYFNKTPANLTLDQCARLAAVIPSPLEHAPNKNTGYVLRRSSIILNRYNNVILFPNNKL